LKIPSWWRVVKGYYLWVGIDAGVALLLGGRLVIGLTTLRVPESFLAVHAVLVIFRLQLTPFLLGKHKH
jgi:hypothetical protein